MKTKLSLLVLLPIILLLAIFVAGAAQTPLYVGRFTGDGLMVNSLNHGLATGPHIAVEANQTTNIFGPFTPGTTTAGIQEALDSLPDGTEYGPTAAGGTLRFSSGYFYFTNALVYSNLYTTSLKLYGSSLLDTKLVYAGSGTGIYTFDIRGGGNPLGGALDLPIHVVVRDMGFSALTETTNVLLRITNMSYALIDSCNFTSWRIMTNNSWGSAVSINGGTLYDTAQGIVGLVMGNPNDHAGLIKDTFFAGLAIGFDAHTDHLYADGLKFAFIGVDGNSIHNPIWPTTHEYSLGAAVLRRPKLDSHLRNAHFYAVHGGVVVLNTNALSGDWMQMDQPVMEGVDRPYAAVYPVNTRFQVNRPAVAGGGEDVDMWRITNTPPWSYTASANTVVEFAMFANGDGSFNGSGITNLNASNLASGTIPNARLTTNTAAVAGNELLQVTGDAMKWNSNVTVGGTFTVAGVHTNLGVSYFGTGGSRIGTPSSRLFDVFGFASQISVAAAVGYVAEPGITIAGDANAVGLFYDTANRGYKIARVNAGITSHLTNLLAGKIFVADIITVTNGVASFASAATIAITATGWTNSYTVNAVVDFHASLADLNWYIKNSGGSGVYTNTTGLAAHATAILQPGGALVITAGTSPAGTARQF